VFSLRVSFVPFSLSNSSNSLLSLFIGFSFK
jgi:hypothetical protein